MFGELGALVTVPTAISGLSRWYAADTLALSHGAAVTNWPDLSGNGADLTPPGTPPVFVANRWNSLPGILFQGDQDRRLSSVSSTDRPVSEVTVLAVVADFKRNSFPQYLAWGNGSTFGFNLYSYTGGGSTPPAFIVKRVGGTWGDNFVTASVLPSRGDPVVLAGRSNGATTTIRVDGGNEVDTSGGDTGNIDYGTGTVELDIGDRGADIGRFEGIMYEILIYGRSLSSTEITELEAYLDAKWRVTIARAQFFGTYDGSEGGVYGIGMGWTPDGNRWKRNYIANPVVAASGGGWKSADVKDPYTLWDGSEWVMFYSGFDGSRYRIGLGTSPDHTAWTDYASNPVLDVGSGSDFDAASVSFATVILDTLEANPAKRWKMWYSGAATGAPDIFSSTIGYAYAAAKEGPWTKHGQVLGFGPSGAWDAAGLVTSDVYRDPATGLYTLLYQGRKNVSAPVTFQGGAATFTDPEGTYTKYPGNPTIPSNGASQALTADITAGAVTVHIADTSAFAAGDAVVLDRQTITGTVPDVSRILTVDSATQLTLEAALDNAYTVADNGRIVHHWRNSITPRGIRKLPDGTFDVYLTAFQPVEDVSHTGTMPLREACLRVNVASLTDTPTYSNRLLLAMLQDTGRWDENSAENFRVISAEPSNPLGLITFPPFAPFGHGYGPA